MKLFFKNLIMLTTLFLSSGLFIAYEIHFCWKTSQKFWNKQLPFSCLLLVMFVGFVWFIICYSFGKPYADSLVLQVIQIISRARLALYWRAMHFYSVILFRRRLIFGVFIVTVAWTILCIYSEPPIYSSTCVIKLLSDLNQDIPAY
jgi:Zn-dependent protease with chaperone function